MQMNDTLSILVAGTSLERVRSYTEVIVCIGGYSVVATTSEEEVKSITSGAKKPDIALFVVSDEIEEEQWAGVERFVAMGHVPVGIIIEMEEREPRELRYVLWGNKEAQPNLAEVEAFIRLVRDVR